LCGEPWLGGLGIGSVVVPIADGKFPLSAESVCKTYRRGGPWALEDVSLGVPAGALALLVGPNGAGKSTLIRSWMGFERVNSGRLAVCGLNPWRSRDKALRRLGYVAQGTPVYRRLSVSDHIALARSARPSFDSAQARDRLLRLGIPLEANAGRLSGGQQAQLWLSLALATRCDVLLLDEPLSSLDPLARREFMASLIQEAGERGTTVLLSTHSVADIGDSFSFLIVLGSGRVLLDGPIDRIVSSHAIAGERPPEGVVPVATFPIGDGRPATLVRSSGAIVASSQLRPASLGDVVMGYLASGKGGATW
jgi:ABC-2 type transport system ATP-binding protein